MTAKLVQLITLFALALSVVYMAQVPNSFGHDPSNHPPEFYVDEGGNYAGVQRTDSNYDPRDDNDYKDSFGNGSESASSWALRYYASGEINGGHNEDNHDENNDAEMVYGARVDLSASAGNSSCSGSVTPSLTDDMGLTSKNPGWSGHGKVVLNIEDNPEAHYMISAVTIPTGGPILEIPVYRCVPVNVEGTSYDSGWKNIEIQVSDATIQDKKSGGISGEVSYGPAKVSGSYTQGTDITRKEVHAYAYGVEFSLGFRWWQTIKSSVASQLDKTATASGNLGPSIAPDSISATFEGEHDCPGSGS